MMKSKRKYIFTIFVTLGFLLSSAITLADPTIDEIITNPSNPTHQSTINVKAKILGDDVSSVNLTISECKIGSCFIDTSYEMTQDNGYWVVDATLQDDSDSSTYIKYIFEVVDSGVEYSGITSDDWKVNLTIQDDEDGSIDNDETKKDTPGFLFIIFIVAITISFIIVKRKRF